MNRFHQPVSSAPFFWSSGKSIPNFNWKNDAYYLCRDKTSLWKDNVLFLYTTSVTLKMLSKIVFVYIVLSM